MAKKEETSKKDSAKKESSSSGGKQKKKKWSKGKVREKLNNNVWLDKATSDKLIKEVSTYKVITLSVISERLKVNGSVARRAIRELLAKKLIRPVIQSTTQAIYTRATH